MAMLATPLKKEKVVVNSEYDYLKETIQIISGILKDEYNMSEKYAAKCIKESGVYKVFSESPEIASHTSYKTWAKRVSNFANKKKKIL